MIIQISVAVIALAVVALTVYAIITLKAAKASLEQANRTTRQLQLEMEEISREVKGLLQSTNKDVLEMIHNTNELTANIRQKAVSLDRLFASASEMGEAVHQVSASVKQVSASVSQAIETSSQKAVQAHVSKTADVLEWVSIGLSIVQKLNDRRNADKSKE